MQNENVKEILLVDDDADEYLLFELALKEIDATIKFTHSLTCSAGIKELDNCSPDLIFLDINLDARTGHDCLKEIKASARFCNIPVVVYSNSSMPQDIRFSYQLGATLYVQKTSTYLELVQVLKAILEQIGQNPEKLQRKYYNNGKYSAFTTESED